jgi:hypothetical protein
LYINPFSIGLADLFEMPKNSTLQNLHLTIFHLNFSIQTLLSKAAIVQILPSAGGTTIPNAGTYALANAEKFDLIAMPNEGWKFLHWTICGTDTGHGSSPTNWSPTDNPYNVNHGYGATYIYQAVFVPVGSTEPTPTPVPEFSSLATIIVTITLAAIAFGTYTFRRKTK